MLALRTNVSARSFSTLNEIFTTSSNSKTATRLNKAITQLNLFLKGHVCKITLFSERRKNPSSCIISQLFIKTDTIHMFKLIPFVAKRHTYHVNLSNLSNICRIKTNIDSLTIEGNINGKNDVLIIKRIAEVSDLEKISKKRFFYVNTYCNDPSYANRKEIGKYTLKTNTDDKELDYVIDQMNSFFFGHNFMITSSSKSDFISCIISTITIKRSPLGDLFILVPNTTEKHPYRISISEITRECQIEILSNSLIINGAVNANGLKMLEIIRHSSHEESLLQKSPFRIKTYPKGHL